MNTPVTLLEAEFPLDKWEGQLKGDQPHLNVEAPAPEKTTLWDGYIKIETAGSYEIKIGADDYGYFTLGGQTASIADSGQYRESDPVTVELEEGWHQAFLSHTNINYKPESGNVSRFDSYLNGVQVELYDIVPAENKPVVCKKGCDGKEVCEDPDAPSGGTSPSSSPSSARMSSRLARSTVSGSSAGTNVAADASQESMYWQCNFGLFRGLPGVPGGQIEIVEEEFTERLWSPSALLFRHALHSKLLKPTEGLSNNCMVAVQKGSLLAYYFISQGEEDNGSVGNIGYNTRLTNRARMLGEDFIPVVSNPVYIEVAEANGSKVVYSVETGDPVRFTASSGQQLTKADFHAFMDVVYAEDGSLRQVSNISDGLASVQDVTEAGYTLALYLPFQVGAKDETTGLYAVTGEPFKRFVFARNEEGDKASVTERTSGRNDFVTTWWKNGGVWCLGKGTGDSAIHTVRTRTEASEKEWNLLTEVRMGEEGMAVSSLMENYKSTPQGNLLMSRTEGYGSDMARTTSYEYSANGVLTKETRPDGSEVKYEQDRLGRQTLVSTPYKGFAEKRVKTTYCEAKFNDHDPAEVTTILRQKNKADVQLNQTLYTYTEENDVRRVEERTTALGAEGTRLEVTETWLASAPNPYARGRIKMFQGIDGVQTVYSYGPSIRYGAAYTVTEETQIDATPVPGQSRRTVSFITAEGNTVREEEHILLTDGTWSLLDSADYEFDLQNRWIRKTRGNGRITERELMCDGRPLWEKDEDGILTSYGYDSARRLVEMIRSATETTPETIISYTRDALGRVVEERKDIGAMSTVRRTAYDELGRVSSETDELGRVTTYVYSNDGLTTTATLPHGATLIRTTAPDGTLLYQGGTGQQELAYRIDTMEDGIRKVTLEPQPEGDPVATFREITNGYGEIIRTATANALGSFYYSRFTYDEREHLVKTEVDAGTPATAMAPTLKEYDAFGNVTKETWKLDENPDTSNSSITTYAYAVEQEDDGVYRVTTTTRNNGQATTYDVMEKMLISSLSATLESKTVSIDARGGERVSWTEYAGTTKRISKNKVPGCETAASFLIVDGITTTQTDHAGVTTGSARSYTETGMVLSSTDARGNVTTTVKDIAGRTVSITDAEGNATAYAYEEPINSPTRMTDVLGHTSCYAYDMRERKIAEWGTGIQPAVFAYDNADHLISMRTFRVSGETITTDPRERTDGDTTTWTYEKASGLLLRKTYADETHEDISYNVFNMITSKIDARNVTVSFIYDLKKGVNTSIIADDGTPSITYAYNHLAQMTRVTDDAGTRDFAYNQYNELVTETTTGLAQSTLTRQRDSQGRDAGYSLQYGNSTVQQTALGYDTAGRLSTVELNGMATPFAYGYNANNGLLETLNYPNTLKRWYTREEKRDLVIKVDYLRPGGQNYPAKVDYTYDALGRPVTKKDYFNAPNPDLTHNYTYNDRGELTADAMSRGGTYSYGYDNIGNWETSREGATALISYEANDLNQYTSIEEGEQVVFVPQHDEAGNQTKTRTATGEWDVAYNALNQAVSFTQGDKRVECRYDYMGRRVEKSVYEGEDLVSCKRFLYRNYLQIAELDATDTTEEATPILRKTYLWDPMESLATRIFSMSLFDETGTYREDLYYTHDLLKNTTALFGIKAGRRALYEYGPYGSVIKMEGNAAELNPFRFSSEYSDDELGLVYYNYRYLNPMEGRWISRDSLIKEDGDNLYKFSGNNPIDFYDILGNDHTKLNKFKVEKVPGRTIAPRLGAGFASKSSMSIELTSLPFCCKVSPSGGPTFLIKMTQEEEAYKRAGVTYDFVKKHEVHHYSDFKRNINAYIDLVNSFSGISGKDCTDLKKYFAAADKYYMAQFDYLNVKLDAKDYKEPLKSKKEQELPAAKTKRDEAKKEFDKLKKKIES
ncbi:RHS repeat-associated core domain-containing protein [Akkermansia sp.]|uniref:RHS repeat domain-containing protein n=1 Tax=Akkermansia sp. TaxID=1872421 RepID=UPI003AB29D49